MAEVSENRIELAAPKTAKGGRNATAGLFYGIGAYTIWGFIPLYFRAVGQVPPLVILCHRILWSAVFMTAVISVSGGWSRIAILVRDLRKVQLLCVGAILIALNWLIFIYAVATHQLLQASLGYFINPLLSIALGMLFLHERLRRLQWVAVLIALGGVLNLAVRGAGVPWIAISLAGTFGFYGLVRKKLDINSLDGLLVESCLLVPFALAGLGLLKANPDSAGMWGMLSLSGVITAVPLLFFGAALRRLKLSTVGFLQYVGPTLQFLVAVCLFREEMDRAKLVSFALCWAAIAVYVVDSALLRRPVAVADEPE